MAHLHARVTALLRCSESRAVVTVGDDLAYPLQVYILAWLCFAVPAGL